MLAGSQSSSHHLERLSFMPNQFRFLAEYNRKANLELLAILEREDPAILRKQTGIYFKSILGTLSHILLSDIAWLGGLTLAGARVENSPRSTTSR